MGEAFDMSRWQKPRKRDGGIEWLKVQPDTTKLIRLLDAVPYPKSIHHFGSTPIPCCGDGCKPCQQGNQPEPYQCVRALEREDGKIKPFRLPLKVAAKLREQVLEKHGNPTGYDIAVTRTGGGKATRYTFSKIGVEIPVDLNGQKVPEWDEIFPPSKRNESEREDETGQTDSGLE